MRSVPSQPSAIERDRRVSRGAILGLILLSIFALGKAIAGAWLCDDSFISLRYAANLVDGLGLVYNAGERVEGYTNLLWTLALAAAAKAGVSALATARYLGVVCYAALAAFLAHWSWHRSARSGQPFLPLAAGLCLVSEDFQIWSSGGLETMLFTALATSALLLTRGPRPSPTRSAGAGLLFGLLVLTRPDGLIFAAAGVASFWFPRRRLPRRARFSNALAAAAPGGIAISAWVAFKLVYYGELLPTAFYSKSVLSPYFSQGFVYLGLYLTKNWFLSAALLVWIVAERRLPAAQTNDWDGAFCLLAAAVFTAYIVEVGGDFMFARRLLPAVPLLFVAIELGVARVTSSRLRYAVGLLTLAAAALPIPLFDDDAPGAIRGVYDERRSYPPETLEQRRLQGEIAGRSLRGVGVRVALEGGLAGLGYYSGLPYLVETTGLTQYSLARQPLVERGTVGHEKAADAAWLAEHRIHLLIKQDLPPLPPPIAGRIDEIRLGDLVRGQILLYSDEVMDALRDRPGVSFLPIEAAVDIAAARMEAAPLAQARRLYEELDHYYFRHAGRRGIDLSQRLRAILARRAHGSAP